MDAGIKDCPFCGDWHVTTQIDAEQGDKWGYAVCGNCGGRGPEVRTSYERSQSALWRKEAIAEWNRRAGDPA